GVERAGSLEAGADRAPDVSRRPLERMLIRVRPRQVRVEAQPLLDLAFAPAVARRRPQVEQRREDARVAVAGVAPDFLVVLLEIITELALAGREQQSRRRVHADAPPDPRVSVLAHRRAGRAVAVLARVRPQV